MTTDNLIGYLSKYIADPKLITLDHFSDKSALPDSWLEILSLKGKERVSKALTYWSHFKEEFEQVVEYLEQNLVSIDLIHSGFGYSLLYGIKSSSGSRILYYEGRNPKTKSINPLVEKVWDLLPESIRNFYDELHNGWFYLASGSMGLSPVEDFFFLDEEDWAIVEELDDLSLDLEEILALYTNGMGGYVCLEFKNDGADCLLWWNSKAPTLNLEFWAVVDSWTAMGFED